jgi:hypothetical protein
MEDTQAIKLLIAWLIKTLGGGSAHYEIAKTIAKSLERWLEARGAEIELEDLKSIAILPNSRFNWESNACYSSGFYTEEVDYSLVRQLARQELVRRELSV